MIKSLFAIATSLVATQAIAQYRPDLPQPPYIVPGGRPPAPVMDNSRPHYNEGDRGQTRTAEASLSQSLSHGQVISIRRVLNGLNQGDFVASLEVFAQAQQAGAYLEVIMDNSVVGQIQLNRSVAKSNFSIRKVNGVDYTRLLLRSVGSTYVDFVRAIINQGSRNQPPPPPPPPPAPQYSSLRGYCADYDHKQFTVAKNFAYASAGLDLSQDASVQWALNYNQTHACGTFDEYKTRFTILKNFAYVSSGLDKTAQEAVRYALAKADDVTVAQAQRMQTDLTAIKNFAYASNGLDLTAQESARLSEQWLDRGYCENSASIQQMAQRYTAEYQFAYSSSGLNYTSQQAKAYALSQVRSMSRCGDLLH